MGAIDAGKNIAKAALKGETAHELLPNGVVKGSSILEKAKDFIINPQGSVQQTINPLYT